MNDMFNFLLGRGQVHDSLFILGGWQTSDFVLVVGLGQVHGPVEQLVSIQVCSGVWPFENPFVWQRYAAERAGGRGGICLAFRFTVDHTFATECNTAFVIAVLIDWHKTIGQVKRVQTRRLVDFGTRVGLVFYKYGWMLRRRYDKDIQRVVDGERRIEHFGLVFE